MFSHSRFWRVPKTTEPECEWVEEMQVDDVAWRTECGHLFQFTADGPKENHFHYCPYCGGKLSEGDSGQ